MTKAKEKHNNSKVQFMQSTKKYKYRTLSGRELDKQQREKKKENNIVIQQF